MLPADRDALQAFRKTVDTSDDASAILESQEYGRLVWREARERAGQALDGVSAERRPLIALTLCLATIDRLATELRAQRKRLDDAQLKNVGLRLNTVQGRIDLVAGLYCAINENFEKFEARLRKLERSK
jgi:hypothetical protein